MQLTIINLHSCNRSNLNIYFFKKVKEVISFAISAHQIQHHTKSYLYSRPVKTVKCSNSQLPQCVIHTQYIYNKIHQWHFTIDILDNTFSTVPGVLPTKLCWYLVKQNTGSLDITEFHIKDIKKDRTTNAKNNNIC